MTAINLVTACLIGDHEAAHKSVCKHASLIKLAHPNRPVCKYQFQNVRDQSDHGQIYQIFLNEHTQERLRQVDIIFHIHFTIYAH